MHAICYNRGLKLEIGSLSQKHLAQQQAMPDRKQNSFLSCTSPFFTVFQPQLRHRNPGQLQAMSYRRPGKPPHCGFSHLLASNRLILHFPSST